MANPNQEIKLTKLFINNEFVDAKSGKTFVTVNPANGKKLAEVAAGDKADVDLAVEAARKAMLRNSEWRRMPPSRRALLMQRLADLIERDQVILANIETLDNGKPYNDALVDVQESVKTLRYYAGYADKLHGHTLPISGTDQLLSMTRKEPVGVVGQIIPWNYPLLMLAWKWGPALAAGCALILKPAEQTPLSALHVASLVKEVGIPPGVINVITGYGESAGAAIANHVDIDKVAFTGSIEVGKEIMQAAAQSNLKRVSLELGGKSPLVILNDVDIDEAAQIAHDAIFTNHGQNCCAGSRTYVQEEIYDKFVKKSVELAKARPVGNPFDDGVLQGPQIDEQMQNKVLGYIESGIKEGAKLECGGKVAGKVGYYVEPTVFSNVTDDMKIAKEEIFGPVQSILKFKTLDEVIERANRSNYGLAAGILTNDINKALLYAEAVQSGSVWVNTYDAITPQTPFGGMKMSGMGRELGLEGLENYLETKTITIKLNEKKM